MTFKKNTFHNNENLPTSNSGEDVFHIVEINNYPTDGGLKTADVGSQKQALQVAKTFIKKWEGLKLEAYQCSANVWTIGYGHTKTAHKGMKITNKEAEKLLNMDITEYYNYVYSQVGNICTSNQIASLTSFAFNLGISALKKSTLLKVIKKNPSNFPEIEKQFMRWIYANKIVIKGLWNRRRAEFELYKS